MSRTGLARRRGNGLFSVAQMQLDPLHPPRIAIENLVFDSARRIGNDFAAHRNTAGDRRDEAADRVDLFGEIVASQFDADSLGCVLKARACVDDERALGGRRDLRLFLQICLLYTSPSPRDPKTSRMPSSA